MKPEINGSKSGARVFAYLRVSGKSQVTGDGFPRQHAAIRAYAKANGYRLSKIFREEGVSGASQPHLRPAFLRMRDELDRSRVRIVVVERLDRLARDLMIQESILKDFESRGIILISASEPDLLAHDPTRKLMRQMLGAFAEFEKSMLVAKLRSARQRIAARSGRCEGAKPYGHHRGERQVLRQIIALREQGLGFDRIAARLNADGVKPRRGKQWWGLTINNIISRQSSGPANQSAKSRGDAK